MEEKDASEAEFVESTEASRWQWAWDIVNNRRLVLLIIFSSTGALGLPLLWVSRSFSLLAKLGWSILATIYTALIVWIFVIVMQWSLARIMQALEGM